MSTCKKFKFPFERPTCIKDIYDGDVFKHLMANGDFLSTAENTGLILCTDGVPVFKSSKGSLWPVYLMVTSIPPHLRTKVIALLSQHCGMDQQNLPWIFA